MRFELKSFKYKLSFLYLLLNTRSETELGLLHLLKLILVSSMLIWCFEGWFGEKQGISMLKIFFFMVFSLLVVMFTLGDQVISRKQKCHNSLTILWIHPALSTSSTKLLPPPPRKLLARSRRQHICGGHHTVSHQPGNECLLGRDGRCL